MDPLVIKEEQLLKQEIFMFLTANMSNAGGVSDFYMNHFIDAEICGLNLKREKYELKTLMLDS